MSSTVGHTSIQDIRQERLAQLHTYWRAVNYLGAAQLHLKANALLREPLTKEHVKTRILGHWGTQPGLNLIYAHLNRLIQDTDADMMLVTGPGHGAPAILANLYLEGTLGEVDERFRVNAQGMTNLCKLFSWPEGLPSHLRPFTPGQIQEGGELGYSLAHAYGAAFDNPELIVACVVGDGEAETGPLAAAWHSNKFLNPARDGAVLPVLHLNGYKIGGLTLLGRMSDEELRKLFEGLGYHVHFVVGDEPRRVHEALWKTLDRCHEEIHRMREDARTNSNFTKPTLPLIVLRTPKGWTGPGSLEGKPVEGTFRAHGTPLSDPKNDDEEFETLGAWLKSYDPASLFDEAGEPDEAVQSLLPEPSKRLGRSPHANGGELLVPLTLPNLSDYAANVDEPGGVEASATKTVGAYLRDLFKHNSEEKNFRLLCPDEIDSNKLDAVFDVTERVFTWPLEETDAHVSKEGRVMEILSEHTCEGWLEGYLTTGRHGLFACYEAFITIIDSVANQYAKWLKSARDTPWRKPIASLNYLLTSHSWRQDHNGYSHQGPGFINTLLTKKNEVVRIYLPPDANSLLAVTERCLKSRDQINLIIASKQTMPQWLSFREAQAHLERGASVWDWAGHTGTDEAQGEGKPDIVLACAGDVPTIETIATAMLLRRDLPELSVRVVNVANLLALDPEHPDGLDADTFVNLFTDDVDVTFGFHGYPRVIHELIHRRPNPSRFHVHGYIEEGSTTTPFDMLVFNRMSRFQLALSVLRHTEHRDLAEQKAALREKYEAKLEEHRRYITEHGEDLPEVEGWR